MTSIPHGLGHPSSHAPRCPACGRAIVGVGAGCLACERRRSWWRRLPTGLMLVALIGLAEALPAVAMIRWGAPPFEPHGRACAVRANGDATPDVAVIARSTSTLARPHRSEEWRVHVLDGRDGHVLWTSQDPLPYESELFCASDRSVVVSMERQRRAGPSPFVDGVDFRNKPLRAPSWVAGLLGAEWSGGHEWRTHLSEGAEAVEAGGGCARVAGDEGHVFVLETSQGRDARCRLPEPPADRIVAASRAVERRVGERVVWRRELALGWQHLAVAEDDERAYALTEDGDPDEGYALHLHVFARKTGDVERSCTLARANRPADLQLLVAGRLVVARSEAVGIVAIEPKTCVTRWRTER